MDDPMTYNVVVTRTFNAPQEQVWKAWSESELVKQWWGPTGFTCPVANMNFREGGTSLVCMRAPQEYGGGDMYNTWTYQNITPMESIEFIQHFTDKDGNKLEPSALGLPPGIPDSVRHLITFKALAEKKTEIIVTEYGYANQEVVAISKAGMEQCLDKMAQKLEPSNDLPSIGKVARRALTNAGYIRLEQLSKVSEKELLKIHGMGPKAIRILREALEAKGLSFVAIDSRDR